MRAFCSKGTSSRLFAIVGSGSTGGCTRFSNQIPRRSLTMPGPNVRMTLLRMIGCLTPSAPERLYWKEMPVAPASSLREKKFNEIRK